METSLNPLITGNFLMTRHWFRKVDVWPPIIAVVVPTATACTYLIPPRQTPQTLFKWYLRDPADLLHAMYRQRHLINWKEVGAVANYRAKECSAWLGINVLARIVFHYYYGKEPQELIQEQVNKVVEFVLRELHPRQLAYAIGVSSDPFEKTSLTIAPPVTIEQSPFLDYSIAYHQTVTDFSSALVSSLGLSVVHLIHAFYNYFVEEPKKRRLSMIPRAYVNNLFAIFGQSLGGNVAVGLLRYLLPFSWLVSLLSVYVRLAAGRFIGLQFSQFCERYITFTHTPPLPQVVEAQPPIPAGSIDETD